MSANITTIKSKYWSDDNGAICCETHAGAYLTASIGAKPKAKSHRTPLGTYELMSEDDVTYFITECGEPCETCRYRNK